jgi:serine/threonine-protein kinase
VPVSEEVSIGTELLGYRVEELIGRGGMSVVYRATDLRLHRQVALKLLAPELARDERFRGRFLTESEIAASLEHPHILPVYGAGEANGLLYIAMRYVEDSDLKRLLREDAPLTPERTLQLLGDVADALDAAHERGLVHRDVKPSNILISLQTGREHAYLADFGLAQPAGDRAAGRATTHIVGTVDYVAREQVEREDIDSRADVYGLGCVLYECLTGEVPFPRDSDLAVLWAHMRSEPPRVTDRRPDLPEAVDRVVAKALAKDPEKRYQSCGVLVGAARDALAPSDVRVVRQRTPLLVAAVGLLTALAATAAVAFTTGDGSANTLRGNTLVRIDPVTNRVSAVIDVGEKPVAVAVHGANAWVYNLGDGTVSQIDTRTNTVRRKTPVSTVPYTVKYNVGPFLAANAAGAWLVGLRTDGSGVVTWILNDGRKQELELDRAALAIAASGNAVWVVGSRAGEGRCPYAWTPSLPESISDVVFRLSPATGQVVARVPIPRACGSINGIAAGARSVWLFESVESELLRIDSRTSSLTGIADLGEGGFGPSAGVPAPGGGSVWVHASDEGGRLVSVDPGTLRPRRTIASVPGRFGAVRYDQGSLWWNDAYEGVVLRFDPDSGKLVSSVRVAPESDRDQFHSSAIATGAGDIWVTVTRAFLE